MNEEQKQIRANLKQVGRPIRKKDAMPLLLGQPAFTEDVTRPDALIVKVLRSPHAYAKVVEVKTAAALKVPDIVGIWTWKDVPNKRYTIAGQTCPEMSPYDRLILDQYVRFVGDAVAIVAGETEKAVNKALKLLKVTYEVLEPVLDYHKALDGPILVHPEEDWASLIPCGADNKRNLVASAHPYNSDGDFEAVYADCDIQIDHIYHTPACNQTPMETFRTYCEIDRYGRLHVVSSTQIVFHCQRIIARALDIPANMVRVEKPRIGGGFGSKQTAVCEVYPAFVTWKTKRPSRIIYTREESQICASPRHEMEIRLKLGADRNGKIRAVSMYTLSNSGAYSEHGPTTVGLSGTKALPLYSGSLEAFEFSYDVVYTNLQSAGAYRGYGATQGTFALESAVNELAARLGVDPLELRLKNIVREGMLMPAYYGETANACALDRCIMRCRDIFGWDEKVKVRDMGNGKVRTAGMALTMQGSCISNLDTGAVIVKLMDQGNYQIMIGAADMGTGCDTTLSQIVAEVLECDVDEVTPFGADTDASPYDSGSYASSTTYITGTAASKAAEKLKVQMKKLGADMMGCTEEEVEFVGTGVRKLDGTGFVSRAQLAQKSQADNKISVVTTASHSSPVSPPPFMCGMVEIELDRETGEVQVLNYSAVVDCGIPVNPNLCRIQTEGGITQGIGMALFEMVNYSDKGEIVENSLMQYKIPSRLDNGHLHVEFENSYEPTSAFGVKSIGEVVINTPSPAIASAIYNATGVWHRSLPITPEKVLFGQED